jgi:hypothetical protein
MAPNAIGILTEDGADAVDANAFPLAASLPEVYAAIDTLINKEHDFQTLFIDSLDWLEPMIQEYVCKQNNWKRASMYKPKVRHDAIYGHQPG